MTQSAPHSPPRQTRFIPLDLGDGLRRQQQEAFASDLVQPFEHSGALCQQFRYVAEEASDFANSLGGAFEPACRAEIALHPLAHHRLRGAHMSSLGSIERATPSTTTMVFCSSSSSGRVRMSNSPVTSNSSVSSFAIEISSAVRLWIGSPMARIAWANSSIGMVRRHIAGLEVDLRRAVIIAGDEAVQDFREE